MIEKQAETRIFEAARELFLKKGYKSTTTRDIAGKSNTNVALVNYYFRSKEKLFKKVMEELILGFAQGLFSIFNDKGLGFEAKLEKVVAHYHIMLTKNPEVPLFMLSEIRNGPQHILGLIKPAENLAKSNFQEQYQEKLDHGEITHSHPAEFLMNLAGLTVFPFLIKPLLMNVFSMKEEEFSKILEKREKLIPQYISEIMKVS
jgi:AcrR family transcriptional regulator